MTSPMPHPRPADAPFLCSAGVAKPVPQPAGEFFDATTKYGGMLNEAAVANKFRAAVNGLLISTETFKDGLAELDKLRITDRNGHTTRQPLDIPIIRDSARDPAEVISQWATAVVVSARGLVAKINATAQVRGHPEAIMPFEGAAETFLKSVADALKLQGDLRKINLAYAEQSFVRQITEQMAKRQEGTLFALASDITGQVCENVAQCGKQFAQIREWIGVSFNGPGRPNELMNIRRGLQEALTFIDAFRQNLVDRHAQPSVLTEPSPYLLRAKGHICIAREDFNDLMTGIRTESGWARTYILDGLKRFIGTNIIAGTNSDKLDSLRHELMTELRRPGLQEHAPFLSLVVEFGPAGIKDICDFVKERPKELAFATLATFGHALQQLFPRPDGSSNAQACEMILTTIYGIIQEQKIPFQQRECFLGILAQHDPVESRYVQALDEVVTLEGLSDAAVGSLRGVRARSQFLEKVARSKNGVL